jgi:hypothetical protein
LLPESIDGADVAPNSSPSSPYAKLKLAVSVLIPLLQLGGAIVQAAMSSTQPLVGSMLAAGLSGFSLLLDLWRYSQGNTVFFPKFLDLSLFSLWIFQMACMLVLEKDSAMSRFLKIYGSCLVTAVLSVMSVVSVLVGRPWIYQLAVDKAEDETLYKKIPGQPVEHDYKQAGFLHVCSVLTKFWALLFLTIFLGGFWNAHFNTTLDDDNRTLLHDSDTLNYIFGVAWGLLLGIVVGQVGSRRLAKREREKLLEKREKMRLQKMTNPVV